MVTRLYLHSASSGLSNLPTTEQSSLTSDKDAESQSINRKMNTMYSATSHTSIVLASNATVSLQRYYFTRFVSDPLLGVSSITAQTWTYNFAATESNLSANFPVSGSTQPVRVVIYVWRPNTQTKVGNIFDGNSSAVLIEMASAGTLRSQVATCTGSSVASIVDGDVICCEVWFEITQAAATSYNDTFFFDGQIVTTANNTTITDHASFIETPQNLTFTDNKLYFHAASNLLSNLPTTTQSSLTSNKVVDAVTVNRTMDKTIGTSQTSLVLTSNATASAQNYYFTRFVSEQLSGITSITAGPWNYNISILESSTNANFPTSAVVNIVRITLYVWRPGTGKVGDILDGNSNADADEALSSGTGRVSLATFTGSSVAGVQNGDVLCFEVWFQVTQAAATAYTDTLFYDGTTVNITRQAATTSHASYIETAQILVLGAPAGPVDCTVTGKTIYNKTTRHG